MCVCRVGRSCLMSGSCRLVRWLVCPECISFSQPPTSPPQTHIIVTCAMHAVQVTAWGYPPLPVSVKAGLGMVELGAALAGRISVVAGPSGVGKSSIINALRQRALGLWGEESAGRASERASFGEAGEEGFAEEDGEGGWEASSKGMAAAAAAGLEGEDDAGVTLQEVGSVSRRIGRGRHTTRNVTLLEVPGGGLLADTPGFNQPDLLHVRLADLASHFPEVAAAQAEAPLGRCAFADCQHLADQGCVVREAGWARYPIYEELHAELKLLDQAASERSESKRRREGTVRYKSRAGGEQVRDGRQGREEGTRVHGFHAWHREPCAESGACACVGCTNDGQHACAGAGMQGAEARLVTKSHRRISRRSVNQRLSELVSGSDEG